MSVNFNDQLDQVSATSGILTQKNVGGFVVANGNNVANKPATSGNNGLIRYNTDNNVLEAVINGTYYNLAIVPTGPTALVSGFLPVNGTSPMTGSLALISGTSSVPGLYFTGSSATGLFSPGANILSISSNSTEALRFNADSSITVYTPINFTNTATAITQVSTDSSTKLATTAFVANSAVPAGTVIQYAGSSAPSGYFSCDGSSIPTVSYPALFAAIGYTYGGAGGNFTLPDMRGVFARGLDNGRGLDPGRTLGSYQADVFGAHGHAITDPGHAHASTTGQPFLIAPGPSNPTVAGGGEGTSSTPTTATAVTAITINPTGGSETRPKNVALLYCIKH